MKKLVGIVALLATSAVLAETPVTLEIHGIGTTDGKVRLSVFDSKKTWLKKPMIGEWYEIQVVDGVMTIVVPLAPGEYAFHVFHDLDDDDKMKTNFIGIPKEPTGLSRDAKGKFGPPKYKDAVVTIGEDAVTLPINMTEL